MTGRHMALAAAMAVLGLSGCATTGKVATADGPAETVTISLSWGILKVFFQVLSMT